MSVLGQAYWKFYIRSADLTSVEQKKKEKFFSQRRRFRYAVIF